MEKIKNKKLIANVLSCCTIIVILCILINAYIQYCNYHIMEIKYQSMLDTTRQEEDKVIKAILNENKRKASLYINTFATDIQSKILDSYANNLDELKFDIQHPKEDSKLSKILDEELSNIYINKDTNSNKPFVTSTSFILWNRSVAYIKDGDNVSPIPLYDFNNTSHNKHLTELAMNCIVDMDTSRDLIFWEGKEPIVPHNVISDMDIDELLEEYNNSGIDVFKSYELLIPAYITNDGDVFGNNDTSALGYKNNNYKIIIIQKVNMYDAIEPYLSDLAFSEEKIAGINSDMVDLGIGKISYISLSIAISFSIFIGSGFIQNKLIKTEKI